MVVKILGMHKQGFIGKQIYCIKCMGSIKLKSADFPHSRASLRKLIVFHFPSNWMRSDSGDSFPFDFEPNGFPFGSKSKGKLSPRSDLIQFERRWNTISFLSVHWRSNTPASALGPPIFAHRCVFATKFQHLLSERLTSLGIMGVPEVIIVLGNR